MNRKMTWSGVLVAVTELVAGCTGADRELPSDGAQPPGSEARPGEARAALTAVEPRMSAVVYHASVHL